MECIQLKNKQKLHQRKTKMIIHIYYLREGTQNETSLVSETVTLQTSVTVWTSKVAHI